MSTFYSPREVARSIGVSESSVKRWVDDGLLEASRTVGGHRRIHQASIVRYLRETGTPVVQPDVLGLGDLNDVDSGRSLQEFLMAGAAQEARGKILSLYLGGTPLEQVFDQHIREALHRIGELWLEREDGVFIEHRALSNCVAAVIQLRSLLPVPTGPRAVGGAVTGDIYVLPTLMVATLLESLNFSPVNLGANTPFSALDHALAEHETELVWLSVSSAAEPETLSMELSTFLDRTAEQGARVVIGGRERSRLEFPSRPPALTFSTMAELAAFTRGLGSKA